jgi:hypothetical protein
MAAVPQIGDKAFLPIDGDVWDGITFLKFIGFTRSYVEGFKAAADILIKSVLRQTELPHISYEKVIPALHLYRQYLELHFKFIMADGENQCHIKLAPKEHFGHELPILWNHVKAIILHIDPNEPADNLTAMESIVNEFVNADESGQEFRYPKFKTKKGSGESLANIPQVFDLPHLLEMMAKVDSYLGNWSQALMIEFDSKQPENPQDFKG